MSNLTAISIYIPFLSIILLTLLMMLVRTNRNAMDNYFIILCFLQLGWFATEILRHAVYIPSIGKLLHSSFLIFLAFIPPTVLLLSLAFHQHFFKTKTKLIYVLLYIIPTITALLVLTSDFHNLILVKYEVTAFSPVQIVELEWGPWFWVHMISSYIILAFSMLLILIKYFTMPKVYRTPATLIIIALLITLVASLPKALQFFPVALDPTIIGSSISFIFFYAAVVNNSQIMFIGLSRELILQYINDFLITLDADGYVADTNAAADKWFSSQGVRLNGQEFRLVLKNLEAKGATISQQDNSENEDGLDISMPGTPTDRVFNMRHHPMTDKKNRFMGTVVIFYDVTNSRVLQERLEATAKLDILTGLPNRTAYEGTKTRLNHSEYLPLTIVMCDLNGLKQINDKLGHEYGDRYLQDAASILDQNRPSNSFLGRIGGDEFIYLLPNTSLETGIKLIQSIQNSLQNETESTLKLSIAMGASSKTDPTQDYDLLFQEADHEMYLNKELIKSSPEYLSLQNL